MFEIVDSKPNEWIDALSGSDKRLVSQLLKGGTSLEDAAEFWLSRSGSDGTLGFGGQKIAGNYLRSVRRELRKLICGDPQYEELRAKIAEQWEKGRTFIVSTIAAAVAGVLNIAAGVLIPVIALLLEIVSRVGTQAWCSVAEENEAEL